MVSTVMTIVSMAAVIVQSPVIMTTELVIGSSSSHSSSRNSSSSSSESSSNCYSKYTNLVESLIVLLIGYEKTDRIYSD